MPAKRKPKGTPYGGAKFKKLRGATDKKTGEYVEFKMEGDLKLEPYKISNRVVWMTPEHAGRVEEQIKQLNIDARNAEKKGLQTRKKRVTIKETTDSSGKVTSEIVEKVEFDTIKNPVNERLVTKTIEVTEEVTKKEARSRMQRRKSKFLERVYSEDYNQTTKAFLAKMDVVANGMAKVLENDTPLNIALRAELGEIAIKVKNMDEDKRLKFYEENYDLFADMSDYYQWLNRHAGKISGEAIASSRHKGLTVEQYVEKNVNSLRTLNRKLDDYV